MRMLAALVTLFSLSTLVQAQDPAEGWLSYAMGVNPSGSNSSILTYVEAKWKVGQNPQQGGAFFSPWFGIESSDNLNLIQPVNPWVGDHWEIYNEYFQWSPENNINSDSHTVQPGDVLFGSVTYVKENSSYTMVHTDLTDGWTVSTNIPIQTDNNGNPKIFNIVYFVMEKDASCAQYPPDNQVTFYDIVVKYDGVQVQPQWTTSYVDDVCSNRAHIIDEATIQITWNVSAPSTMKEQTIAWDQLNAKKTRV